MATSRMDGLLRLALLPLAFVCVLYIFKKLRLAYDPDLRKIPGPFLCRFTNLRLKLQVLSGNRMHWVYALHQRYGPFVRISPNEIAVADVKACREVHKIGTSFTKSAWYQNQTATQISDDTCGVFGVRDPAKAIHRRRFFQQAGTKNAVVQWEPQIRAVVEQAVSKIKRDGLKNGKVDIMKWWGMMTADVLSSLAFGEPFEIIEKETKPQLIEDIEKSMMMIGLKLELPIIYHILSSVPLPWVERPAAALERLEKAGERAVENTKAAPKRSAKTLFSKMYPEDGEQPFSDELMSKESTNIIIAGVDTTAMALTYLVYEVIQHPEVKKQLLDELASCSEKPSWDELESKRYLNNVIQEVLRLHPPVGALPRSTPAQGAVLGGHKIPGGTIVVTQAYITHRDPMVFPDPEQFKPERWNDTTPEMKQAFMAFGGSARVCLGQNLARLELLHAVSSFLPRMSQL